MDQSAITRGIGRLRAQHIRIVYEKAVSTPGGAPNPESTRLLDEIRNICSVAPFIVGAELE